MVTEALADRRLRELIQDSGVTQREIAEYLAVSPSTVSRWSRLPLGAGRPEEERVLATIRNILELRREHLERLKEAGRVLDVGAPEAAGSVAGPQPIPDEMEAALLSRWSATLAAGDPKSFNIVVTDVIRRLHRIEELAEFAVVRLHAASAAASLDVIRAAAEGEVSLSESEPTEESLALLVARLAALGMVAKYPQLALLVQAAELILHFARDRRARSS